MVVVPFRLIVVEAVVLVEPVVVAAPVVVPVGFPLPAGFDGAAFAVCACSACWRACWTAAGSWSWNLSAACVLPTEETRQAEAEGERPEHDQTGERATHPRRAAVR